jgi:hypothetical protein
MVIDKQLEKLRCFYTQSISCESCQITSYFKRLDNQIQNMTEMKIIICLLTKIFNAQLGFESRAIQDGVLTMLSLYTKQLVRNLSTTSPVIA